MCGIWAIFGSDHSLLQYFIPAYNAIHHRGPDAWRIENDHHFKNCCLGFHRLAIVDDMFGMQPMRLKCLPNIWLVCNGEIYNFERLGKQFGFTYETKCDVEVIIHLYVKGGIELCTTQLEGVFAFCLLDMEKQKVFIARDTFGVRPGFRLTNKDGFLALCSEAKGLMDLSKGLLGNFQIEPFPPGRYETYRLYQDGRVLREEQSQFHFIGDQPKYEMYLSQDELSSEDVHGNIRKLFTGAVRKRLMAHRRIGCLLSGGLDSSLVAALLLRLAKEEKLPYEIQTFAIGMNNSPDIIAARQVAKHIGSEHHEVIFTEKDVIDVVDKVIYHLESYDITTIRASIGMYLLSKYISTETNTIVIFSGEGSDELAQGYIYFRDAPTPEDGDKESRRLLEDIYLFDALRSDRMTAAHGLELRVPFLDHQFTSYYLSLPKEARRTRDGIEKFLLRQAFDSTDLLPKDILWRHKEAFSDGVASTKGKSLFHILQEYAETKISDDELQAAAVDYPKTTPKTKEALYYRNVFDRYFPGQEDLIPYYWMPRWTNVTDPSARFLSHYAVDD